MCCHKRVPALPRRPPLDGKRSGCSECRGRMEKQVERPPNSKRARRVGLRRTTACFSRIYQRHPAAHRARNSPSDGRFPPVGVTRIFPPGFSVGAEAQSPWFGVLSWVFRQSARERTRTSTGLLPLEPESSASTNSATRALPPGRAPGAG